MKKICVILGLISALIATILSVTKFSNLAITPIIIAFLSGLIVLFLSKKERSKTKAIQYIFLLVIISLSLTIYKGVISPVEVIETEQLELLDEKNSENSKKTIDGVDVEEIEVDDDIETIENL